MPRTSATSARGVLSQQRVMPCIYLPLPLCFHMPPPMRFAFPPTCRILVCPQLGVTRCQNRDMRQEVTGVIVEVRARVGYGH